MRNVKPIYAFATTIYSAAWGVLFSFITRYIAVELSGGVRAIILFTALNWGFTLFGLLAGRIAHIIGEKRVILLGSTCSLPVIVAIFVRNPFILSIIISTTTIPWVFMWSVLVKLFFAMVSENYGQEYSEYTIGMGIGFFIGSTLTGFIYALGGSSTVFIASSILLAIPPIMYYKFYPFNVEFDEEIDPSIKPVVKKLCGPLLSLAIVVFSRELLYSIAPSKLDVSIDSVLPGLDNWLKYTIYGIIYSGGALISPFIRVLVGKTVDYFGSIKIYVFTVIGYTTIYWLFVETRGLIPILVWQIPLYPFLDISFNVYVAQNLDSRNLVSGFGATHAFTAIGGLMLTPILIAQDINLRVAGFMITLLNTISIILISITKTEKNSI
ncbi:MAG: MFS transporter [Desulfurococcaceae archaeon]